MHLSGKSSGRRIRVTAGCGTSTLRMLRMGEMVFPRDEPALIGNHIPRDQP